MMIPMQYDHFGYEFLDLVPGNKIHPGWDLNFGKYPNADLGLPIYTMTEGEVVFSRYAWGGWGNMIVIYHPKIKMWTRYAHLQRRFKKIGEKVSENEIIASCGNSGTSAAHLHWDLIKKELPKWTDYTKGWSENKVKEYYMDGIEYVENYVENLRISDWALPSVEKAIKKKIATNWENPQEIIGTSTLGYILQKLKLIKKVPSQGITKEQFIVALDRAKIL